MSDLTKTKEKGFLKQLKRCQEGHIKIWSLQGGHIGKWKIAEGLCNKPYTTGEAIFVLK